MKKGIGMETEEIKSPTASPCPFPFLPFSYLRLFSPYFRIQGEGGDLRGRFSGSNHRCTGPRGPVLAN